MLNATRLWLRRAKCAAVLAAVALTAVAAASPAAATLEGLNQIVTPDIQPFGVLSAAFLAQQRAIGNPGQLQLEYGISPKLGAAVFRGFSPGRTAGGIEYGLIQQESFLLSFGVVAPGGGRRPQPFLEAGYLHEPDYFVAGAIAVHGETQALLGWTREVNEQLTLQFDYQSGSGHFATAGFTYNLTPTLQLNPALFVSNSEPHHAYGLVALTWNVTVRPTRRPAEFPPP
jgi:hypothetical protein